MAEGKQRRSVRISGLNAWKAPSFARGRGTRRVPQLRNGQGLSGRAIGGQRGGSGQGLRGRRRGRKKRRLRAVVEVVVNSLEKEPEINAQQEGQHAKQDDHICNTDKLFGSQSSTWMPEKRLLQLVLDILQKKDTHEIFAEPVDAEEVEGYYDIIKEPMDFGTMRAKLQEGIYTTWEEFERDVLLISSNAMHFNSSSTIFFRQARAIQELAKKTFHSLKTDPEKFELENSNLKRKSGNFTKRAPRNNGNGRSQGESRGSDSSMHAVTTNVRQSNMPVDVSSGLANGRLGSLRGHLGLLRNAQPYPTACSSTPLVDARRDYEEDFSARRSTFVEEERRSTYKSWNSFVRGSDSIFLTLYKNPHQLINNNQWDFGYAESLSRFVADLGPTAQRVACRKLKRCQIPLTSTEPVCNDSIAFPTSSTYGEISSHPMIHSDHSRMEICSISNSDLNVIGEAGKDRSSRIQSSSYFPASRTGNFDSQSAGAQRGLYYTASRARNLDPQIAGISSRHDSIVVHPTRENSGTSSYQIPASEISSEVSQSRLLEIVSRGNSSEIDAWVPGSFPADAIQPGVASPITGKNAVGADTRPTWLAQGVSASGSSRASDSIHGLSFYSGGENSNAAALWAPSCGASSAQLAPGMAQSRSRSDLLAPASFAVQSQQPAMMDMSWVQSRLVDMSSHGRNGFSLPEPGAKLPSQAEYASFVG